MKPRSILLVISIFILLLLVIIAGGWWWFKPLEKKNKSGLQIITGDEVVSIFLNNEFLGKSPYLTKDLKPGKYNLTLEPENHQLMTYNTTINLHKGLLSVITWKPGVDLNSSGGVIYELEKLSGQQTELSIISIPDGAIVGLDQQNKQFTPLTMTNLEAGSYELEVSLPSYETQQHTINVVKGHRLNILVKLAKEGNFIIEASPLPTPTPTPTPTATNSADPTAVNPTTTVLGAASPSATTITLSQTGSKVLIKPTNYFSNGQEVLKVRDASSSAGQIIGVVKANQEYPFLEETLAWIKIEFSDENGIKTGWISKTYAQMVE